MNGLNRGVGALLGTLFLGTAGLAQAGVLQGVFPDAHGHYQAYYDSTTNLTWLANADLAGTTMTWSAANTWASSLDINGITGWTLPTTSSSCFGYNCVDSQMGNLFYDVLGGRAGIPLMTNHNGNYDLFSNIRGDWYWSSTDYQYAGQPYPTIAWTFSFGIGYQYPLQKSLYTKYAWAVHPGDVGMSPGTGVPEPGEFGLAAMAMAVAGFAARRRLALR